ncbi:MAG: divalent metal cation transporter, partial [Phycisphaerales bacterium]|nr:divalent metal cation transporter [Phycisphaerales bacterium]
QMGPGYMQSAMTLGGGTAFASIFAGAAFGYQLLWVPLVGMGLGIIVLAAVAHQTLSTDEDPYQAMKRHAGAFFAISWGVAAILSSIIWQFAQYALASSMLVLLLDNAGISGVPRWVAGLVALAWCVVIGLMYDRSARLVRVYENVLKGMVWVIILCFAFVVFRTGVPEPGRLVQGFVPSIPEAWSKETSSPISATTVIVAGLAAAVGVNMLFVYPYSLRRREWGREHRRFAQFDLVFGMLVPYVIAATLITVSAASVLHFQDPTLFEGQKISPDRVALILADADRLGPVAGVWIFGLGVLAMALSSITMQMLCSGFACETMFGWKRGTPLHAVGTLLPAIGVLGAVFWNDITLYVALPTTIICGGLMPIAYIGFIILQRSRSYLGKDRPEGAGGAIWILGMVVATIVLVTFLVLEFVNKVPGFIESFTS